MHLPGGKRWFSVSLLAVVLPISLLAAFRLTGVLPEPPPPETTTVDAVSWNMSRPPFGHRIINNTLENSYVDGNLSIRLNVHLSYYYGDSQGYPSWGNDYIKIRTTALANLSEGFIESSVISFRTGDDQAFVEILEDPLSWELYNVEILKIRDPGIGEYEAYVRASGINLPKQCSLSVLIYGVFIDKNTTDHWITVNLEAVYFNGRVYRKVVIPIMLGVVIG